jgi:hypothetical protein
MHFSCTTYTLLISLTRPLQGRISVLLRMIKRGKLENILSTKPFSNIPKSENLQTIEVTRLPNGGIRENDETIEAEKAIKLEALKSRYGAIDESQIVWVMVKRQAGADA